MTSSHIPSHTHSVKAHSHGVTTANGLGRRYLGAIHIQRGKLMYKDSSGTWHQCTQLKSKDTSGTTHNCSALKVKDTGGTEIQ